MPIIRILRLLLTLLALGFAMANPAVAVPAMTAGASGAVDTGAATMPCHETEAIASKAMSPPAKIAGGAHLCCVLACLVVPPLGGMTLSHPVARAAVLTPPTMLVPRGRMVAMPTPPPRFS
ncbi:hypothetical protein MKI84_03350 [Ancylobacter sp. A5.8]|uniref:hypothetical protein n=1 Tax=Ancylobacter gelatini TaxID=2919920 RepID=UPI001F4ECB40|nr:hypothetical protein [Ancylobacter gelatini]MCJ8141943.1 hypothetical protein [Ancylobacter gelatini]